MSPANIAGVRAGLINREGSKCEMARRVRENGVPLGELFSFMSSLYFRGKLAYARAFAHAPENLPGVFVITASGGLLPPDSLITLERLRQISLGNVDPADGRYREPLVRDAHAIARLAGKNCEIVLLGSIATSKYVGPLLEIFGEQLLFPAEFVGRGDMSRGGLLLRCVESGKQLTYIPVSNACRHGKKPPKLEPLAANRARNGRTVEVRAEVPSN